MKKLKFPSDLRRNYESNIESVHAVILRMLKVISLVCEKHDIQFWLDYGTMLGAVRHQGFIPWDSEADIGMLREDFETLKKVIAKEIPEDMFFQTEDTDPLYKQGHIIEAKFRDRYSNYIGFEKQHPNAKWHNGIQVDVFVYDRFYLENEGFLINSYEKILTNCTSFFKFGEISELVKSNFADTEFYIPAGYHSYLERNYKDYSQFPSLEEQRIEEVSSVIACTHPESLIWV